METILQTWRTIGWIAGIFGWLTSPSVAPWMGAVAAAAAAGAFKPRVWLDEPRLRNFWRGTRSALAWLVLVWLMILVSGVGSGMGRRAGDGEGGGGSRNSQSPAMVVRPGEFPPGTPSDVVLLVQFVGRRDAPARAQEFMCDVVRQAASGAEKCEIRATDMAQFDRQLEGGLDLTGQDVRHSELGPRVRIAKTPFPGESVVRHIRQKIVTALPNARVEEQ